MRRVNGLFFLGCLFLAACGSSDGNGGDDDDGPNPPPPAVSLYVTKSGNDDASGRTPEEAFLTLERAAQFIAPNVTVYVGPGRYEGSIDIVEPDATGNAPIRLIADPLGEFTLEEPGEVILDADGRPFVVRVSRTPFVTIDGFIMVGAASGQTAIQIRSESANATVRNCVISNAGPADGIRVQNSENVLIFNNLLFDNNRGIRIADGARGARIINNTIVATAGTGISIGGVNANNVPASDAQVLNNIIQDARNNVSIAVDDGPPSSRSGYQGNFNLAFAPDLGDQTKTYRPSVLQGPDDINEDALFVDIEDGDFRLTLDSPAIDAGTNAIGPELLSQLFDGSTSPTGQFDSPPVDLGYHYPVVPTPEPEP